MNLDQAKQKIMGGAEVRRPDWQSSRIIRRGQGSDYDFINYDNLEDQIVAVCPEAKCDCTRCLYSPTEEDKNADDFEIVS